MGIENKVNDLDTYWMTSYLNMTPYDSEFKQTQMLRNYQYNDYLNSGKVPGENVNKTPFGGAEEEPDDDDDMSTSSKKSKFEGALVGDPRLNLPYGACLYGNKPSNNIFEYAIDMDMSSFYPSTIMAMNIDPSCLIFKCILDAGQFDLRGGDLKFNSISQYSLLPDKPSDFHDDVAKECFDNFQTGNVMNTAHKWLNLPSVDDIYYACLEELGS